MRHLFEEVQIGSLTVKNRLIMPALNLRYCPDGEISERIIRFYERRAAGGVGLIVVGGCLIEEPGYGDMVCLGHDRYISGLKRLTDVLHVYGTKVAAQLFHAGRYASSKVTKRQAVAPSPIPSRLTGEVPRALTFDEIQEVIRLFGQAARRAKEAGFDAVEVIGSAGYLVSQFFSPLTNNREDAYGGSLKNRMRFGLEIVQQIKKEAGADYPVLFRISGHEFMPGGNTNTEAAEFCIALERTGVDAFDVTGGWHESPVPQITMQVPRGAMVYLARGIKEAVHVPVVACNRITDPVLAEEIIKSEAADLIGLGRVLVADPDWPRKAQLGRRQEIRPCVGCNQGCLDEIFRQRPVRCLVNAEAGREAFQRVEPAAKVKRVMIVGGGPAGLEAARVAAERGHAVTLWEQDNVLGGQLNLAGRAPGREEWETLRRYLIEAIQSCGVSIHLGKRATVEDICAAAPDVLIIATGAEPSVPNIPGVERAVQAWDILRGTVTAGRRVAVIGAGAVGCETALFLARQGTLTPEALAFFVRHRGENWDNLEKQLNIGTKEITLIEAAPKAGASIGLSTRWVILNELAIAGVVILTNTRVLEITPEGVITLREGSRRLVNADTVVLATGARPQISLAQAVAEKVPEVFVVGDAVCPRNILEAIHEGYRVACQI
ncbi:MAG: FAD-dependent oxidoreductase [Firmicutes bacterium]|nr:FAD-dependent oxidoreductase [Bacillota bacterium]